MKRGKHMGLPLGKAPETGMAIIDMRNQQQGRRRGRGGPRPPQQGGIVRPDPGRQTGSRGTGNAAQMLEKYKTLARDATQSGDRITAEYYFQYADHYFRVLNENRPRFEERQQQRPQQGWQDQGGDAETDSRDEEEGYADAGDRGYAQPRGDRYRGQDRERDDSRSNEPRYPDRTQAREVQAPRESRPDREPRVDREPRAERNDRDSRGGRDARGDRYPRTENAALDRDGQPERDNRRDPAQDAQPPRGERWPAAEKRAAAAAADPFARANEPEQPREAEAPLADAETPRPRRGRPRREDAPATPRSDDPFAVRRSPARPAAEAPQASTVAESNSSDATPAPKRRRRVPRDEPGSESEVSLENA